MNTTRKLQAHNQISSLSVARGSPTAKELAKKFHHDFKVSGDIPAKFKGMTIKQRSCIG